ncbi:MAG: CPBP family intramembrane metalloprotease [Chloroflexi bacterium]|nr:CPBP family intramembrane metalloprotease [Chloroflexota bacterium]
MSRTRQPLPWGLPHILLIILLTAVCWGIVLYIVHFTQLLSHLHDPTMEALGVTAALYLTLFLVILTVIGSTGGLSRLGFHFPGWRPLLIVLACIPAWYLLLAGTGYVAAILFNHGTSIPSNVTSIFGNKAPAHVGAIDIALAVLVVSILAPLVEETLFRGVLYQWLHSFAGTPAAVILSAALFGGAHFILLLTPVLFVMGCVLAVTFQVTKSLFASMLLHSVNNTVALLVLLMGLIR